MFTRAWQLGKEVSGEVDPYELYWRSWHGPIIRAYYEDAEPLYAQEYELRKKAIGEDHANTLTSMYWLAQSLDKMARFEEAEVMFSQISEIRKRTLG